REQMSERRATARVKAAAESKTRARRVKATPAPSAPEVLAAALMVSQCLELERQLQALLDVFRDWSGAVDGAGFGPDPEGPGLAPLVTTMRTDDPRLESLRE